MKKLFFTSITLLLISCGSVKTFDANLFKKEIIIENLPENQNALFIKANDWMVSTFNNSESVIEFSDKEAGIIIGKYLVQGNLQMSYLTTIDTRIFAKITVQVKDNKAKINVTPNGPVNATTEGGVVLNNNLKAITENFKKAMQSANTTSW